MHTIRLRAAWRIDGDRAVRRFNRPTGIEGETRVWLAWDGDPAEARLNDAVLSAAARHDVTEALQPSNELVLSGANTATRESVRLEIEPG
ncbi:MAG: hypothetical protein AAF266_02335 [Planctomycetota bacterium]